MVVPVYNSASHVVATGVLTASAAAFVWWPLAVFAMIALVIALGRIFVKRQQIQP